MINSEVLLLIQKHTDALLKQTKAKPQGTLELKQKKRTETSSFYPSNSFLKKENGY